MVTPHQYPNLKHQWCLHTLPADEALYPEHLSWVMSLISLPLLGIIKAFSLKQDLLWPYPGHNIDYVKSSINCRLCRVNRNAFQPLLHDCAGLCSFDCIEFHARKRACFMTSCINKTWLAQRFYRLGLALKSTLYGDPTDTNKLGLGYSYHYRSAETPYYISNNGPISPPIPV